MNSKVTVALLVLAGVALVWADKRPSYQPPQSYESDHDDNGSYDEAKYDFSWSVEDDSYENHYGHREHRDGDHTEGSYYVDLPDGRRMTVTYYVDGDSGYVPEVEFEGSAEYHSDESSRYNDDRSDDRYE